MAYSATQIDEIFNSIIQRIELGESLRSILKDENMPSSQTFYIWINDDESKSKQYARATEIRADLIFDEMIEIADDGTNDFTKKLLSEIEVEMLNSEHLQRSRLRIDTRKWILSKMNPKKYGDKLDLTTKDKELPQPTTIVFKDFKND